MKKIDNVADIARWRLCLGCGACAAACPDEGVNLYDFPDEGIRPLVDTECGDCHACLDVCPAMGVKFPLPTGDSKFGRAAEGTWGPMIEIWQGHAVAPDIRHRGASGGVLSAIGAYCVEKAGMHGVLHVAADPDDPIRNRTTLSRTRQEILAGAGSRYSPASVCNGLNLVRDSPAPCAVIGKPAEIAALRKAQSADDRLGANVGVALSFFCAESPSTRGTTTLLEKLGVSADQVADLRYRGFGWPGYFAPTRKGEDQPHCQVSYRESWGILQAFRPWSVQLWPDGGGELADISCGDPWYTSPDGENPGSSLVVVRTSVGERIVRGAIEAGYLELRPAELWKLERSQQNLIKKKGAVWGRLTMMRVAGLPTPASWLTNTFSCWRALPLKEKLRSTAGTLRRIFSRKLRTPLRLDPDSAVAVKKPIAYKR